MKKSLLETMEEKFKVYSAELLATDLQIEDLELDGKEVPKELYEKYSVMWDNIDFILAQVVRLGYMSSYE